MVPPIRLDPSQLRTLVREGELSDPVRVLSERGASQSVVELRTLAGDGLEIPVVTRSSSHVPAPANDVVAAALAPDLGVDDLLGWSYLRGTSSVSQYVPGRTAGELGIDTAETLEREGARLLRTRGVPSETAAAQARLAIQRMHAFDYAIGNTDRNRGNVMLLDAAVAGSGPPPPGGPFALIDEAALGTLDFRRVIGDRVRPLHPAFLTDSQIQRGFIPLDDAVLEGLQPRTERIAVLHEQAMEPFGSTRGSMLNRGYARVVRSPHMPTAIHDRVEQMRELRGIPLRIEDTRGLTRAAPPKHAADTRR